MKFNLSILLFVLFNLSVLAQPVLDFKTKNERNVNERTQMLDLLRKEVRKEYGQEVVFVVNHFKVCGNYAYLESVAQRKDGKNLVISSPAADCCNAGALFVKNYGKWQIAEQGIFRTDMWNWCIAHNYPKADRGIFSEMALSMSSQCD